MAGRTSNDIEVRDLKVLSVGQIAKLCRVYPRTIVNLIDSGKIKGFRIRGDKGERRVHTEDLVKYLRETKQDLALSELMGVGGSSAGVVVLIGLEKSLAREVADQLLWCLVSPGLFAAGVYCRSACPSAIVFDSSVGRSEIAVAAEVSREWPRPPRLVVLISEDDTNEEWWKVRGFLAVARKPTSASQVASAIGGRSL